NRRHDRVDSSNSPPPDDGARGHADRDRPDRNRSRRRAHPLERPAAGGTDAPGGLGHPARACRAVGRGRRLMRRVWASLVAVWATLAIVAVLAWSHMPAPVQPQAAAQTLVIKGKNGKNR